MAPMITRRTRIQLRRLRADHPDRRQLRRGPLRPARPACSSTRLHRRRALRGLRRHLRRRRGDLPRRPGRPGREARAHRRRRRRLPRHRQRVRRHPGRHARRRRQPLGGRRAVRRAPAADRRASRTCGTRSEIAMADTRTPIPTQKLLGDISTTVESVDQEALQTTVGELGSRLRRHRRRTSQRIIDSGNSFIDAANANFDMTTALIRDSNTVLTRPDRLGERDPHLRPAARAVHRHAGGLRQGPARGDRQRLGDRQRAAHASSRTTRSTWPS